MEIEKRMKNMLISDKHFNTDDLIRVLRCDLFELLSNYMNINVSNLGIDFNVDENGIYNLKITVTADRLKIFGSVIN